MSKYAPGEVTPAQLEEYRQRAEATKFEERLAWTQYVAAYRAWCATLPACKDAEAVYLWAKQGMVRVEVEP